MSGRNLSSSERVNRYALGSALLSVVFVGYGPLGSMAWMPIASILPFTAAMLGFCPVKSVMEKIESFFGGGSGLQATTRLTSMFMAGRH